MASDFHNDMGSYVHSRKQQARVRSLTERVANKFITVKLKVAHGFSKLGSISFGKKKESLSAEVEGEHPNETAMPSPGQPPIPEESLGEIKKLPAKHLQQLLEISREKGKQLGNEQSIPPIGVLSVTPNQIPLLQYSPQSGGAQETAHQEAPPKKEEAQAITFGNFIRNFFHHMEAKQPVYESTVTGESVEGPVAAASAQEVTPEKVDYRLEESQQPALEETPPSNGSLPPNILGLSSGEPADNSPRRPNGEPSEGLFSHSGDAHALGVSKQTHGPHELLGFISIQRASDYERDREVLRKAEESQREQEALAAQRLLEEEMEKVDVPSQQVSSQENESPLEEMGELFPAEEQEQKDVNQEEVIELDGGYRIQVVQNK